MFYGLTAFNQDNSNWNVSSGTSFVSSKEVKSVNAIECESSCGFFYFLYTIQATFSFTITSLPLLLYFYYPKWGMFYSASAFNQDISNWNVSSGTSFVSSKEVESVNAAI